MIKLTYFIGDGFAAYEVKKEFDDLVAFEAFLHKEHDSLIHYADTATISAMTFEDDIAAEKLWKDIIELDALKAAIQKRIDELRKYIAGEKHWLESLGQQINTHQQSLRKHENKIKELRQQLEQM
ncbi:hypothetical protein D3C80_1398450 [compost metagenome]